MRLLVCRDRKATIVQKDFGSQNSKTSIYVGRCFTAHNVVKIYITRRQAFVFKIDSCDFTYMEWKILHGMVFIL